MQRLWPTKFGILLEKERHKEDKSEIDEISPTIFSLTHPLDEVCPVAISQGSVHLLDDAALTIVFTSEDPSICMVYNSHTSHHSVYRIRRVRTEEVMEVSAKYFGPSYSINVSDKVIIHGTLSTVTKFEAFCISWKRGRRLGTWRGPRDCTWIRARFVAGRQVPQATSVRILRDRKAPWLLLGKVFSFKKIRFFKDFKK